jgi:hypothetical protein
MKKEQIKIGETYFAKVSGSVVRVRIDADNSHGGWDATNLATNKKVRIKSAQRLRGWTANQQVKDEAKSDPDLVPLTKAMKPAKAAKGAKTPKAPKAEKADKPKRVSCLDAAVTVLKAEGKPLNCKAMIDAMFAGKLWHSDAPTPAATLYSAILREMQKKGTEARFTKTERGLFAVNAGK